MERLVFGNPLLAELNDVVFVADSACCSQTSRNIKKRAWD